MNLKSIDAKSIGNRELYALLTGTVTPRPIAWASTIDKEGAVNLAPFSYFNVFGSNPPTLIFSPNRRGRDRTTKNTFDNLMEVPEVVINMVSYDIVRQMSITSVEYGSDINEFEKAGLTMLESQSIKPYRVAESPVQFECKVNQIVPVSLRGGAPNLIICEVQHIHLDESLIKADGKIDSSKLDICGRLGGGEYVRVNGDSIFSIDQPPTTISMGFDQLPENIRNSKILSGSDLAQLASFEQIPAKKDLENIKVNVEGNAEEQAKTLIAQNKLLEAWKVLLDPV
ncbi:MAG: flavin reductase family protein [Chitinophagales bacterium]